MEVEYLILARHAETAIDGSFNVLGAGVDTQPVLMFPVLYPVFYVVSKITLDQDDIGAPHNVRIRFVDQTDEIIITSDDMQIPAQEQLAPDRRYRYANFVLNLHNLLFRTEGLYRCQLLFDGRVVKESRLRFELQVPTAPARVPTEAGPE